MFKKKLAGMKKYWEKARANAATAGGSNVPDGKYIAKLSKAEVRESQEKAWLHVAFEFVIVQGEQTGEIVNHRNGLETEENQQWLARDLKRLGKDPESIEIEDMETTCAELQAEAPTVRLTVKTKGDFVNVYIDKLVEDVATEGDPIVEGEEAVPEEVEGDPAVEGEVEGEEAVPEEAPKSAGKKPSAKPVPAVEEEETVDLKKGAKVVAEVKGKKFPGKVLTINEDDGNASVRLDKNGIVVKVAFEDLEAV